MPSNCIASGTSTDESALSGARSSHDKNKAIGRFGLGDADKGRKPLGLVSQRLSLKARIVHGEGITPDLDDMGSFDKDGSFMPFERVVLESTIWDAARSASTASDALPSTAPKWAPQACGDWSKAVQGSQVRGRSRCGDGCGCWCFIGWGARSRRKRVVRSYHGRCKFASNTIVTNTTTTWRAQGFEGLIAAEEVDDISLKYATSQTSRLRGLPAYPPQYPCSERFESCD